jgi:hypothetical protein
MLQYQSLMTYYLVFMNLSRNFLSIRVIIFITSLRSILIIDLERTPKIFNSSTKQARIETRDIGLEALYIVFLYT